MLWGSRMPHAFLEHQSHHPFPCSSEEGKERGIKNHPAGTCAQMDVKSFVLLKFNVNSLEGTLAQIGVLLEYEQLRFVWERNEGKFACGEWGSWGRKLRRKCSKWAQNGAMQNLHLRHNCIIMEWL